MISVVLQNPSGVAVEWKRGSPATPSLTDGAKYSGATTTTLTIMNVDESDDATYSAMLSRTSPIACSTFTTQGSLTVCKCHSFKSALHAALQCHYLQDM